MKSLRTLKAIQICQDRYYSIIREERELDDLYFDLQRNRESEEQSRLLAHSFLTINNLVAEKREEFFEEKMVLSAKLCNLTGYPHIEEAIAFDVSAEFKKFDREAEAEVQGLMDALKQFQANF